jgi:phosphoglycerate dehydrogenase-like enzyme
MAVRVALAPAGTRTWLADAVVAGGAELADPEHADALVWADTGNADALAAQLTAAPRVRWVQLPWAGIEPFVPVLDEAHTWTCGKGVYAEPVAEMALTLLLAGLRNVVAYGRATSWTKPAGHNLLDADVAIVGGGGITESLLRLLGPWRTRTTVVRKRPAAMDGAAAVVGIDDLDDVLAASDAVVLALALTPETIGLIDRARLERMRPHAWVVNVARGRHIVTDDLVATLRDGAIGGAGLDVTDPEPLPEGHPLWSEPRCVITPHVANTPEMALPLLSGRITDNVRRFISGEPLLGLVDAALGY